MVTFRRIATRCALSLAGLALASGLAGCHSTPYRVHPVVAFDPRGLDGNPSLVESDLLRLEARFTTVGIDLRIENRSGGTIALQAAELEGEAPAALTMIPAGPLDLPVGEVRGTFIAFGPGAGTTEALDHAGAERIVATDPVVWSSEDQEWRFVTGGKHEVPDLSGVALGTLWPRQCEPNEPARAELIAGLLPSAILVLVLDREGEPLRLALPFRVERVIVSRLEMIERYLEMPRGTRVVRDQVPTLKWAWFREDGGWRTGPERKQRRDLRNRYRPGPVVESVKLADLRPQEPASPLP